MNVSVMTNLTNSLGFSRAPEFLEQQYYSAPVPNWASAQGLTALQAGLLTAPHSRIAAERIFTACSGSDLVPYLQRALNAVDPTLASSYMRAGTSLEKGRVVHSLGSKKWEELQWRLAFLFKDAEAMQSMKEKQSLVNKPKHPDFVAGRKLADTIHTLLNMELEINAADRLVAGQFLSSLGQRLTDSNDDSIFSEGFASGIDRIDISQVGSLLDLVDWARTLLLCRVMNEKCPSLAETLLKELAGEAPERLFARLAEIFYEIKCAATKQQKKLLPLLGDEGEELKTLTSLVEMGREIEMIQSALGNEAQGFIFAEELACFYNRLKELGGKNGGRLFAEVSFALITTWASEAAQKLLTRNSRYGRQRDSQFSRTMSAHSSAVTKF